MDCTLSHSHPHSTSMAWVLLQLVSVFFSAFLADFFAIQARATTNALAVRGQIYGQRLIKHFPHCPQGNLLCHCARSNLIIFCAGTTIHTFEKPFRSSLEPNICCFLPAQNFLMTHRDTEHLDVQTCSSCRCWLFAGHWISSDLTPK